MASLPLEFYIACISPSDFTFFNTYPYFLHRGRFGAQPSRRFPGGLGGNTPVTSRSRCHPHCKQFNPHLGHRFVDLETANPQLGHLIDSSSSVILLASRRERNRGRCYLNVSGQPFPKGLRRRGSYLYYCFLSSPSLLSAPLYGGQPFLRLGDAPKLQRVYIKAYTSISTHTLG